MDGASRKTELLQRAAEPIEGNRRKSLVRSGIFREHSDLYGQVSDCLSTILPIVAKVDSERALNSLEQIPCILTQNWIRPDIGIEKGH